MKTEYRKGIRIVKHFLDDVELLSQGKYSRINFSFYKKNYENLLFYISKTLICDNYDKLSPEINLEFIGAVVTNEGIDKPTKSGWAITSPSKYIDNHLYCKMPERLLSDPRNMFRVLRIALCHYKYVVANGIVTLNGVDCDNDAEISIASLIGLLRGTLLNPGNSYKKGAYHYYRFLNPFEGESCFFRIENLTNNLISPIDIAKAFKYRELVWGKPVSPRECLRQMRELSSLNGNYYIKREKFDKTIMKKAHISSVSTDEDYFLYLCALEDSTRAGLIYEGLIDLIFSIRDMTVKKRASFFGRFYSLFSNTLFITYMSLVFDDLFSRNFDGTISSGLFVDKPSIEDKNIPWKFRNSLAHSRYSFEDIFNPSKGIIVEFWDEDKGVKNFECRITKENAMKLIDEYLKQV